MTHVIVAGNERYVYILKMIKEKLFLVTTNFLLLYIVKIRSILNI